MPPQLNPLPELVPNRMAMLRRMLKATLWENRHDLTAVISPIQPSPLTVDEAAALDFQPIRSGDYFGAPYGEWEQAWFRVDVPAPQPQEAGRRFFFWDSRGETVAYLDGQPYAGLDVAHPYCKLPDRACTLWLDTGTYQTCMWYPGAKSIDGYGLRFEGAWTACRNLQTWEVYWDLDVLVDYVAFLSKRDNLGGMVREWGPFPAVSVAHPVLRRMLAMFDDAWQAWERGGIPALGQSLKRIFAALPAESWQPSVTMLGHSHLDLVWMWPEVEGNRKAIHTIATALRLLDEYPQYQFMWTSPHIMKLVEERYPQVYEEIKARLKEGRWEATGGAWVEFDTLIATGEALGRSLVLGQKRFKALRGEISDTVWLPDCFGFNGFLPQIMRLGGVTHFYTSKLSWSSQTRFPYDSFVWRSADGSEVLTHLDVTSEGNEEISALAQSAERYRELAANGEFIKFSGVGDGGGGTTVDSLERLNRLGNLAQVPPVKWGKVEDFFARLETAREKLPVFEGELYLEFHRGIYTTQSEYKRRYRRLERALQVWEAARVLAGGAPVPDHAWERLSFIQFHDSIPGSSIKLVYDQLGAEMETLGTDIFRTAEEEATAALRKTLGEGQTLTIFNPIALDRQMVVEVPAELGAQTVKTAAGERGLVSVCVQGLGVMAVAHTETGATGINWEVSPRVMDNGVIRVEFDETGALTTVHQCTSTQNCPEWPLIAAPHFRLHPDYPPTFDAWEIDHITTRHTADRITGAALTVTESGPVRATLTGISKLGDASQLTVRYILEADSELLRVEVDVDWREEHRVLRYYLPTACRGRMARYGAPFGALERQQTPGMPREEAAWEVPASRWAAVTDDQGQEGMAIITEAKYGFACRDGELALTLLRAPSDPAGPTEPGQRHRTEYSTERGNHTLRFAIGRYQPITRNGRLSTAAQAEALYAPALISSVAAVEDYHPLFSFVSDLNGIVPAWVLPSTQPGADGSTGYIIRLHETLGVAGTLGIAFETAPAHVTSVDFLEREVKPESVEMVGPSYAQINYGPYQVISLRVER